MRTKYAFIWFERFDDGSGKTSRWWCKNNKSGDVLGRVAWYGPWRQYCFEPEEGCVFNRGCLADIQDFIQQLMGKRIPASTDAATLERCVDQRVLWFVRSGPVVACTQNIADQTDWPFEVVQASLDRLVDSGAIESGGGNLGGYVLAGA